jgi:hypothetical protein
MNMEVAREVLNGSIHDLQALRAEVVNAINEHGSNARDKITSVTRAGYGMTDLGEAYRMIEAVERDVFKSVTAISVAITKIETARG